MISFFCETMVRHDWGVEFILQLQYIVHYKYYCFNTVIVNK